MFIGLELDEADEPSCSLWRLFFVEFKVLIVHTNFLGSARQGEAL